MTAFPLLAAQLYGTPLMVDGAKLEAILAGLAPRLAGQVGAFRPGSAPAPAMRGRPYSVTPRGIAVVDVVGLLVSRAGQLNPISAPLRSYAAIRRDLVAALADPAVKAVVLEVDSPGGEVAGLELGAAIYKMRGRKPLVAVANSEATSAGYALAAAADVVFIPPSGVVGGIGIVAVHRDESERNKMDGLSFTLISAGDRKTDGHPHGPLSPRARSDLEAKVTALHHQFCDQVARHRGLTAAAVSAMEARRFMGAAAVKAGLATRVGTLADAVAEAERRAGGRPPTRPAGASVPRPAAVAAPPVTAANPPIPRPPAPPMPPPRPPAPQEQPPARVDPADPHGWLASIARTCGNVRSG